MSSWVSDVFKGGDSTCSLGHCLNALTIRKLFFFFFFLCFDKISCIFVSAHCLLYCHWSPLRSLFQSSLFSPYKVFIHMDKISPSLLFTSPSSVSLSWCDRCSSPLIIFVGFAPLILCLSCSEEPVLDPEVQMYTHLRRSDGNDHLPWPADYILCRATQKPLVFCATKAGGWLKLLSTRTFRAPE